MNLCHGETDEISFCQIFCYNELRQIGDAETLTQKIADQLGIAHLHDRHGLPTVLGEQIIQCSPVTHVFLCQDQRIFQNLFQGDLSLSG